MNKREGETEVKNMVKDLINFRQLSVMTGFVLGLRMNDIDDWTISEAIKHIYARWNPSDEDIKEAMADASLLHEELFRIEE